MSAYISVFAVAAIVAADDDVVVVVVVGINSESFCYTTILKFYRLLVKVLDVGVILPRKLGMT